jgi:hypothetical protein
LLRDRYAVSLDVVLGMVRADGDIQLAVVLEKNEFEVTGIPPPGTSISAEKSRMPLT